MPCDNELRLYVSPLGQITGDYNGTTTRVGQFAALRLTASCDPNADPNAGCESDTGGPGGSGESSNETRPPRLRLPQPIAPEGVSPPGHNPATWTTGPSSRPGAARNGYQSFYDPSGNEWQYQTPTPRDPDPHWNFKGTTNFDRWGRNVSH